MEPSIDRAMVQSRGSGTIKSIPATTVVLVAEANPQRVALAFATNAANLVVVHPGPEMNINAGGIVRATLGPTWITLRDHGDLVRMAWYALSGGVSTLAVWESISDAE